MDAMMASGDGTQNSAMNLADNEKTIEVFENDLVEGSWTRDTHVGFVGTPGWAATEAVLYKALKAGARANDDYVIGMKVYPEFHGWAYYEDPVERCNYVASYFYFVDLAQDIYADGTLNEGKPSYLDQRTYNTFKAQIRNDGIGTKTWYQVFNNDKVSIGNVTKARQCAFLYGMALHVATDTFAHSAYVLKNGEYVRIVHGADSSTGADSVNECKNRVDCAKEIADNVVRHYYNYKETPSKADASPSDFILTNYNGDFKLRNLTVYLKAMGTEATNLCNTHKDYFTALNYTK